MKTVIFTFLIGLSLFNFPAKSQVAIEINTQSVVNKEFKGFG
jgi:hypothetical protein